MMYQRAIVISRPVFGGKGSGGSEQRQRPAHDRAEKRIHAHEKEGKDQRHDRDEDSGGHRFLARGPDHLAQLHHGILAQLVERLALLGLQGHEGRQQSHHHDAQRPIQGGHVGEIAVTGHGGDHQCSHHQPFDALQNGGGARLPLCFLSHLPMHPAARMAALGNLAGQEGLEPPTAGFGDRCSTN